MSFIALADPAQQGVPDLLRKAHALYADFALKNPFYAIDMPIKYGRCATFASWGRRLLTRPFLQGPV